MWPDLIQKANDGKFDAIETYIFGMFMSLSVARCLLLLLLLLLLCLFFTTLFGMTHPAGVALQMVQLLSLAVAYPKLFVCDLLLYFYCCLLPIPAAFLIAQYLLLED